MKPKTPGARRRRRLAGAALPAETYRGDARHWLVERHDYEWHAGQRRRFYTDDGYELATADDVAIALAAGAAVWSR